MSAADDPTSFLREVMPFCGHLGLEVVSADADAAGGACASLNLPDGAVGTSTIES